MMRLLLLVALSALIACSGRNDPALDSGPSNDSGTPSDAGQADVSSSGDAGSCADPQSPCSGDRGPSSDQPCMPWNEGCDHVHLCGGDEPRWCYERTNCLAIPGCEPGSGTTDPPTPCGPSEPNCSIRSLCGQTIFCRPMVDCEDEPSCPPSYLSSRTPCGIGEPDCRGVYGCNQARWCRVDTGCDGVATCARGIPTEYPCAQGEVHCERVSQCGMTVFCRY
jgi:hypothetical protein